MYGIYYNKITLFQLKNSFYIYISTIIPILFIYNYIYISIFIITMLSNTFVQPTNFRYLKCEIIE